MILRKPIRVACIATLLMICFLFTSLAALYLNSNGPLVEKQNSSYSSPIHQTSQPDKQVPMEGSEKEEESRSDRSEQSFAIVLHQEISARFTQAGICRLTYFVRSVETSQAWLPLYLTKRSFLI